MLRIFTVLLLFCLNVLCAQNITLSGFVFGYKGERVLLLKNARKNISFEGALGNASVNVSGSEFNVTAKTNLTGFFSVTLKPAGVYKFTVSHPGYSTIVFDVHLADAGKKTQFGSFYLLLKDGDNTTTAIGTMSVANGGTMYFSQDNSERDRSKSDLMNSNASLLEKAAFINNSPLSKVFFPSAASTVSNQQKPIKREPQSDTGTIASLHFPPVKISNLVDENLDTMRQHLSAAKALLSSLDPNGVDYDILLKQIRIAEQTIAEKESIIKMQDEQLEAKKKKILYLSLFGFTAAAFVFLLLFFLRQRKIYTETLQQKNNSISIINNRLYSGIRFASLIQKNLLQDKSRLKNYFENSFVYNRPKDIVSGDFYWCTQKNNCTIIVSADCTGHGVPGALLTVLGHNALEEIVNIHGETTPSRIIMLLSHLVRATFANSPEDVEGGMDLTVISIPDNENYFLFSGVVSGVFMLRKNEMRHYAVTPKPLGNELSESDLEDQRINFERGDCVFLFTDGFHDQFSDNTQKIEKFNIKRFAALLRETGSQKTFDNAEAIFDARLEEWKGERDQTDDIMIVGIKF